MSSRFCVRDIPSSDASREGDFAFPEKFDVFVDVFQEVWWCRFDEVRSDVRLCREGHVGSCFFDINRLRFVVLGEPQSPSSASLVVALR